MGSFDLFWVVHIKNWLGGESAPMIEWSLHATSGYATVRANIMYAQAIDCSTHFIGEAADATLTTILDWLDQPLIVFDLDGRERHRTRALATLIASLSESLGNQLIAAAAQTAADKSRSGASPKTGRIIDTEPGEPDGPGSEPSSRQIQEAAFAFRALRVTATVGPDDAGTQTVVLVAILRRIPHDILRARIRARFSLTKRETDVALLLADRMHNREIAETLCVSVHTARHHTERVMEKMNIRRRVDVRRIFQTGFSSVSATIMLWLIQASVLADPVLQEIA